MADIPETPEPFSLKRWSQRKRAAAQTAPAQTLPPPAAEAPAAIAIADTAPAPVPEPSPPLPPVDSLTFDSDYSAFMQPKIAEETKRAALRKLFSDPSFNVMDGLDIYVGDYTQSDPMPSGMLEKLSAAYAMLDPVEPARDEKADAAVPVHAADPAPAPEPDTRDAVAAEPPAEPARSTPDAAVGDTPPKAGHA
jgi:hypothetical protein